jgi:uncharacterized membrane protein YkvA (DUF1232 family)
MMGTLGLLVVTVSVLGGLGKPGVGNLDPSMTQVLAAALGSVEDVCGPAACAASMHLPRAGVPGIALQILGQPIEERLSVGSMHLLRSVRQGVRRLLKTVSWSLRQWADWTTSALGIVLVALCAPLLDRQLLRAWRDQGFGAFRASLLLALAVYVRLLFDRRAPAIGKALLVCSVLYGVGPADLIPDRIAAFGLLDDLIAVGLASRVFARLCPDWLVEEHAAKAARAWERARRARLALARTRLPERSQPLEGRPQ